MLSCGESGKDIAIALSGATAALDSTTCVALAVDSSVGLDAVIVICSDSSAAERENLEAQVANRGIEVDKLRCLPKRSHKRLEALLIHPYERSCFRLRMQVESV